ncbi:DUF397 domain-containing protein [Streptomyces sp. SHP 1-2]|uniref:DUF397 domain-containing protein n=1 Tax=Streptomyces sp. SHP 1-2 TaxID=2769489 RepID=UPI0022389E4A|nr:DUF397 domain-containing protein [Streptomyces sp. SHP 1-2]MCW5253416.1 DUF397 domain-containing protein [Streptomyces sp. SHP 1-2]
MSDADSPATVWFRSSYSDTEGGQCLEIARARSVRVRDSKAPTGPVLTVSRSAWAEFLGGVVPGPSA